MTDREEQRALLLDVLTLLIWRRIALDMGWQEPPRA